MSKFSLDKEMYFEVMARFIAKGNDLPVTGTAYKVRLYDKELFSEDDCIGESNLDANGIAKISFRDKVFENIPNLGFGPEFYLTVIKNGSEIFKSKVVKNIDLEIVEQYKKGEGEVIDFGTFLIDA